MIHISWELLRSSSLGYEFPLTVLPITWLNRQPMLFNSTNIVLFTLWIRASLSTSKCFTPQETSLEVSRWRIKSFRLIILSIDIRPESVIPTSRPVVILKHRPWLKGKLIILFFNNPIISLRFDRNSAIMGNLPLQITIIVVFAILASWWIVTTAIIRRTFLP